MKTFLTAAAMAAPMLTAALPAQAQNAPNLNTGANPSAGVTGQPSRQPMGPAATLPDPFSNPVSGTVSARPATPAPTTPSAAPPASTTEVVAPDVARSQRTLRGFIEDVQAGRIDYTIFSDNLAQQVRSQEGAITPLIQGFGPVKSIDFVGQENGADLFMVAFDKQLTQWIIGFDAEDQIAALLFRPAEQAQP